MENWGTFLLVNVLVAMLVGVITNLITPWIKEAYDRSIFASRKQRRARLIRDYRKTKAYAENYSMFLIVLVGHIVFMIFMTSYLIAGAGIYILEIKFKDIVPNFFYTYGNRVIGAWILISCYNIVYIILFIQFFVVLSKIQNVLHLKNYKSKTIKKLIKLGGNPEDLDKEETSSEGQEAT